MNDAVKVLTTTEIFLPDERGAFHPHVRVTFKVGDGGPFTRDFARDTFNAAFVTEELERFARELRNLPR
jgi:hypothetical protein